MSKYLLDRYMQEEATAKRKQSVRASTMCASPPIAANDKPIDFLQTPAAALAEQLTLLEHELFAAVPVRELLGKMFMNPGHAPHYTRAVTNFNQLGLWVFFYISHLKVFHNANALPQVGTEVLKQPTAPLRATVISQWLKIAKHCVHERSILCSRRLISARR